MQGLPALKRAVVELARDFSLEVMPADLADSEAPLKADAARALRSLAPHTRVYITWVPGKPFAPVLQAAVRLRAMGLQPVPHLSARAIADVPTLDRMLQALRREADVTQVLLIGGSQQLPVGGLTASQDVLASGLLQHHGFGHVAFAAHPDGSPEIAPQVLADALQQKTRWASSHGLAAHLVTQFCFDAPTVLAWERGLRQTPGPHLPVHVGLAGLASLPTLVKYAKSCGIGPSVQTLLRQSGRMLSLASGVAPGAMVVALAQARLRDPHCGLARLHFFPFGALQRTVDWALALTRGDFELTHEGTDLRT